MTILSRPARNVNPRDSWPASTDADRWVATHAETGPTTDFGFAPTILDDDEATALLNDGAFYLDLDPAYESERMALAFADPFDLMSDGELAECRGHHPAMAYDL